MNENKFIDSRYIYGPNSIHENIKNMLSRKHETVILAHTHWYIYHNIENFFWFVRRFDV